MVWSERDWNGYPAGMLHWGRFGEGTLCGKDAGYETDFDDMKAALATKVVSGNEGVWPCAKCGHAYPKA